MRDGGAPCVTLIGERWRLANADLGFGTSLFGPGQTVAGPTPLSIAQLDYRVPLIHDPAWLDWEAWIEARRGRMIADEIAPRPARCMGASSATFTGGVRFTGGVAFI